MQTSTARHSSKISIEPTAFFPLSGTGSDVLAVATRAAGVCSAGICGKSVECGKLVETAWPIVTGSSEAAAILVVVRASAAADASELPAATSLIAVTCGGSVSSALAERGGARRSSPGLAPRFSTLAEPKPARLATTQPARTTVGHNAAAAVVNRRLFMIPASKGSVRAKLHSHACDSTDFSGHNVSAQWRKPQASNFSNTCCLRATRQPQATCCTPCRLMAGEGFRELSSTSARNDR